MDILGHTYEAGNQLLKVADAAIIDGFGFKDDALNTTADTSNDYTYDANGNLKSDANKSITAIQYNYLNLPTQVSFGATKNISYIYDASGTKLKKVVNDASSLITTEYAGNYVYENNILRQISTAEGYVEKDGLNFRYVYYYKDHQNNVRLTYSDLDGNGLNTPSTEILHERNYYPFGLVHKGYNSTINGAVNNYKQYQDQEFTEDLGLNIHEWKFRISDPAIGRFWQIDPLADKYVYNGVYNFSENRVIDGKELEGLEWVGVVSKNQNESPGIQYTVKIKVLNNSSLSKDQVKRSSIGIANGISKAFSGVSSDGINISTKVKLNYVSSVDTKSDYYIDFVDNVEGGTSLTTGKVNKIGDSQSNRIQIRSDLGENTTETGQHEIGHTVGLRHENDSNNPIDIKSTMGKNNIMNSAGYGNTIINSKQLSEMKNHVPVLLPKPFLKI